MRITARIEATGGFTFDKQGRMLPVGGSTCVIRAYATDIYVAPITDYTELRRLLEELGPRSYSWLSEGREHHVVIADFALESAAEILPTPNEEALIEWLSMCIDSRHEPAVITATVQLIGGTEEKRLYYAYADSVERMATGEHWSTIEEALADAVSASWVTMVNGVLTSGELDRPFDPQELFEVAHEQTNSRSGARTQVHPALRSPSD